MVTNNNLDYAPTQHLVQIGGANGTLSSLSASTSGNVLISAGAGVAPSFLPYPGSNWRFVSQQTASTSSSIDFTSGFSSTYQNYVFVISGMIDSVGITGLCMQWSDNGGSSYATTNYVGGLAYFTALDSTFTITNQTSSLQIGLPATADPGFNGVIWFMDLNGDVVVQGDAGMVTSGSTTRSIIWGSNSTPVTGVNAVRFLMPSDTIASGTISMYQIVES